MGFLLSFGIERCLARFLLSGQIREPEELISGQRSERDREVIPIGNAMKQEGPGSVSCAGSAAVGIFVKQVAYFTKRDEWTF